MKVITNVVRMSYLHTFTPTSYNDGPPRYSATLLIDKKDSDTLSAIDYAIEQCCIAGKEKWGKDWNPTKLPLRDGDVEKSQDEAYQNKWYVNAHSTKQPTVVGRDTSHIITSSDEFYSGCYGKASITFYPFSHPDLDGIAVALNNLQKWEDGERLGQSSAVTDFKSDY